MVTRDGVPDPEWVEPYGNRPSDPVEYPEYMLAPEEPRPDPYARNESGGPAPLPQDDPLTEWPDDLGH